MTVIEDPFTDELIDGIFQTSSSRPDFLRRRESTTLEVKENFHRNSFPEYGRTLAAFANRAGGYILFGVENQPHRLTGMTNDRFTNLDPNALSQFLNNHFSPPIDWAHYIHDFQGNAFGLIYAHPAATKPVVCSTTANPLREGDIYYRYQGETRLITSADLHALVEERIESERKSWRDMLRRTARSSPSATYLLDVASGRAVGEERSFVISQELLEKVKFIHEGHFTEGGEPTLKVIGDVEVVKTELLPGSVQEVPVDPSKYCNLWEQDVVAALKEKIGDQVPFDDGTVKTLNGYHVRCIRSAHSIDSPSKMYYRPDINGSRPQYGQAFVDWVVEEFEKDNLFLCKAVRGIKSTVE